MTLCDILAETGRMQPGSLGKFLLSIKVKMKASSSEGGFEDGMNCL